MTRHFLKYWKFNNFSAGEDPAPEHSASNHYERVSVGDEIWGVTQQDKRLTLFRHLRIDWLGSTAEVQDLREIPEFRLAEGEWHILTEAVEPYKLVDINNIAEDLRFITSGKDRLTVVDEWVNPQQLQTMRELTPETAQILHDLWYAE